jgi:vacuolar protein sorting-associated protein 11
MENFVVFLEAVARRRWGQSVDGSEPEGGVKDKLVTAIDDAADKQDQVAVWNTLLELYLTLPDSPTTATTSKGGKASLRSKALNVLQSTTIPYDPTHALILCSSWAYTPGLVLLWEKRGMYEDVLRFWMDKGDPTASKEVIRYLNLYGPARPHLYPLVLRFLTSTPELLARHREDVGEILKRIDEGGLMPPLGVVQVLSRNGCASVGMVKEWLMGRIREEREEIETVRSPLPFRLALLADGK